MAHTSNTHANTSDSDEETTLLNANTELEIKSDNNSQAPYFILRGSETNKHEMVPLTKLLERVCDYMTGLRQKTIKRNEENKISGPRTFASLS